MNELSIIIPCYNSEDYIIRCLDSLKSQTCVEFEIVIIDDYSSDNTIKIIEEYKKNSNLTINVLKNDENKGPSLSREKGIKYCKTKYVCFCDSDDTYEEHFIELMLNNIIKYDAELAICDFNDMKKNVESNPECFLISIKYALSLNLNSMCRILAKRNIFDDLVFPNIKNGEDMAIIPILLLRAKNIIYMKKPLYNYLYRKNSTSNTYNSSVIESLLKSLLYIENNLPSEYYDEKEFKGIEIVAYGCILYLFKYSYNKEEANKILDEFEHKYKKWIKNKYLKNQQKHKKIFLWCVYHRKYFLVKIMSVLHSLIIKIKK